MALEELTKARVEGRYPVHVPLGLTIPRFSKRAFRKEEINR